MRDILYNTLVDAKQNTAVIDAGVYYTYEQLLSDVEGLHKRIGRRQGTHILMSAQRCYTSIALYVYSVIYQCTLVPVSAGIDEKSLERLIDELPVRFFYTDNASSKLLQKVNEKNIPTVITQAGRRLDEALLEKFSQEKNTDLSAQKNPYLYLIFTSGSTGNPKGVTVAEQNLLAYMEGVKTAFGFSSDDVISHISPLTFDFSIHEIFIALYNQCAIAILRENDKFNFAAFLRDYKVSVWSSVPSTLAYLQKTRQLKKSQYPDLRLAFVGGEPVSVRLLQAFSQAAPNCTIFSYYGPTECTVAMMACLYQPGNSYERYMPLGAPFGGHRVLIRAEGDETFSESGRGEAYIAGPQVLEAYWNNPQQTRQRFSYDEQYGYLFKTGDIVERDQDGTYHFITRDDDDIKIGGYRFDTAACREFISSVSGADDVVVTPTRREGDEGFTELLVITANADVSETHLAKLFRDNYDNYIQPRFFNLPQMPRNENGKIDKRALLDQVMAHD